MPKCPEFGLNPSPALAITGIDEGSYDLVARRFASFPLFMCPVTGQCGLALR